MGFEFMGSVFFFFFFQAEDGIRDLYVTGVQTCALPIYERIADEDGWAHAHSAALSARQATCPLRAAPAGNCPQQTLRRRGRFSRALSIQPPMPSPRPRDRKSVV